MLELIISGGQTGADQGGLRAGRTLGLRTGGWAPRGWITLDGPAPWLADYGVLEAPGTDYPTRTLMNVRYADATVRFAMNFNTPGERCTMRAIERCKKPHIDIQLFRDPWRFSLDPSVLRNFLVTHQVRILNVAGNSERGRVGFGVAVERYLVEACRT